MGQSREQVSRILAVGSPSSDGVQRLTRGGTYVCCAGDADEHEDLARFCRGLESLMTASGLDLHDFSPAELREWVAAFAEEPRNA